MTRTVNSSDHWSTLTDHWHRAAEVSQLFQEVHIAAMFIRRTEFDELSRKRRTDASPRQHWQQLLAQSLHETNTHYNSCLRSLCTRQTRITTAAFTVSAQDKHALQQLLSQSLHKTHTHYNSWFHSLCTRQTRITTVDFTVSAQDTHALQQLLSRSLQETNRYFTMTAKQTLYCVTLQDLITHLCMIVL